MASSKLTRSGRLTVVRPISARHPVALGVAKVRQVSRHPRHLPGSLRHHLCQGLGGQQHQRSSTPCSRERPAPTKHLVPATFQLLHVPRGCPYRKCDRQVNLQEKGSPVDHSRPSRVSSAVNGAQHQHELRADSETRAWRRCRKDAARDGAIASSCPGVSMMQPTYLRDRDDLALARRFDIPGDRSVAIQ